MHLPNPRFICVDPALVLAAEDRRKRSASAMAAAVLRFSEQSSKAEADLRAAVLAYAETASHPVHLLVMGRFAPRPTL